MISSSNNNNCSKSRMTSSSITCNASSALGHNKDSHERFMNGTATTSGRICHKDCKKKPNNYCSCSYAPIKTIESEANILNTRCPNYSNNISMKNDPVDYLNDASDASSRFFKFCKLHADLLMDVVCQNCEAIMCELCFSHHACSNDGVSNSLSLSEYAKLIKHRYSKAFHVLDSYQMNSSSNFLIDSESETKVSSTNNPSSSISLNSLKSFHILSDHITKTIQYLVTQLSAFRDEQLKHIYWKSIDIASKKLSIKQKSIFIDCFRCIDDFLNSIISDDGPQSSLCNNHNHKNKTASITKNIDAESLTTDSSQSINNGVNQPIFSLSSNTNMNLIDALSNIKSNESLLKTIEIIEDQNQTSQSIELDVTAECKAFENQLHQQICRLINSQIISVPNSSKKSNSSGHTNSLETLMPSNFINKFASSDANINMSANEYANASFGHITQPPGMSPSFTTHIMAPSSLQSSFQTLHNSSLPNVSFEFLNFQNPINLTEYGLNQMSMSPLPNVKGQPLSSDEFRNGDSDLNFNLMYQLQAIQGNGFKNVQYQNMNINNDQDCDKKGIRKTTAIDSSKTRLNSFSQAKNNDNNIDHMDSLTSQNIPLTYRKNLMQIRKKFGDLGSSVGQFNSPHGFCLDSYGNILIADTNNHRILFFSKDGELFHHFGISGRGDGQLWYPRKIAVMRNNQFVVCDRGNDRSRMQIFNYNGEFIRPIAIRFIDIVASIAINEGPDYCEIIVVDSVSPTVYVISELGEIISWFDCSEQMKEPSDLAFYNNLFFICDFKGHQVVVYTKEGIFHSKFGGEHITNFPNGIDILSNGNILVGDSHGNRFHIVIFDQKFNQINEFECPFVKVSRCCGLKVMPDKCIVTLAKNNHHVLILNQLIDTVKYPSLTSYDFNNHNNSSNSSNSSTSISNVGLNITNNSNSNAQPNVTVSVAQSNGSFSGTQSNMNSIIQNNHQFNDTLYINDQEANLYNHFK